MKSIRDERNMVLSTQGYGAASLPYKLGNTCHKIMCEAGSPAEFKKKCMEFVGYVSDQGTDFRIADGTSGVSETGDLAEWNMLMASLAAGECSAQAGIGKYLFLFPAMIGMPDHSHLIFGALERAAQRVPGWSQFHSAVHALSTFLAHKAIMMRYVALCVTRRAWKVMLLAYVGKPTDWKWEHFATFCWRLLPLLPILAATLDDKRVCDGVATDSGINVGMVKINALVIREAAAALRLPALQEKVFACAMVGGRCDREGNWCEGCPCHQFLLDDASVPWRERVRRYRLASDQCWRKGLRSSEMSLRKHKEIPERIRAVVEHPKTTSMLVKLPIDLRELALAFLVPLANELAAELENAFEFWTILHFMLLGAYGHADGIATEAEAKLRMCDCMMIYDDNVRLGKGNKLHRVAHLILCHGSVLRAQAQTWHSTDAPLEAFPQLHKVLRGYSLIPIVCRRIEAAHAEFQHIAKRMSHGSFALKAARMRRHDVESRLSHDDKFWQFLYRTWRSRDWLSKALSCLTDVRGMSKNDMLGVWYQCSLQTQFKDRRAEKTRAEQWHALAPDACTQARADETEAEQFIGRFAKSFLEIANRMWSVPRALLEGERAPLHSNMLVIYADMAALVTDAAAIVPFDCDASVFFMVTEANPERRHRVRALYESTSSLVVSIIEYSCVRREGCRHFFKPSPIQHLNGRLDLRLLARPAHIAQLRSWEPGTFSGSLMLPGPAREALCSLDDTLRQDAVPLADDIMVIDDEAPALALLDAPVLEGIGALVHVFESTTSQGQNVLELLLRRGAIVNTCTTLDFADLGINHDVLDVLVRHEVLRRSVDEFMVETVQLDPERVLIDTARAYTLGNSIVHESPADYERGHKLAVAMELIRREWVGSVLAIDLHTAASPKTFSWSMMARSKYYFIALLHAERIYRDRMPDILAFMPEWYYRLLLSSKPLDDIIGKSAELLRGMGNDQFKKLCDTESAVDVGLAIAHGHEVDDMPGELALPMAPAHLLGPVLGDADAMAHMPPRSFGPWKIHFSPATFAEDGLARKDRAWVQCTSHDRCFKYRNCDLEPDELSLFSFLIAWAELGPSKSREEHVSQFLVVPEDDIAAVAARLRPILGVAAP